MKRLTLFLLVFISLSMSAVAQEGGEGSLNIPWPDRQVWPESPRAAQLRQVMMPSPGLLTGAVEFEIPIYTIEAEGVSLPISLKYRSNGIKVDDDPQPVGYGWTLTPALRVTRRIMGRPDGYFPFSNTFPKNSIDEDGGDAFYMKCLNSITLVGAECDYGKRPNQKNPYDLYDSEYDFFYFYLPDKTLTMIYHENSFIGVDCNEYKFENDEQLTYIHVTDPRGVKYCFDIDGETTGESYYVLEMLISKIILPSGQTIEVKWKDNQHTLRGLSRTYPLSITHNKECIPWVYEVSHYEAGDGMLLNPTYGYNIKDLASITFPGGKAVFNYGGNNMLESISVFVPNSHDIVDAKFEYSAKTSWEGYVLTKADISSSEKYIFEYNTMPYVEKEPSTDWWGYFNGKSKYTHRAPYFKPKAKKDYDYISFEYPVPGDNKDINESLMTGNLLKKAICPTGAIIEWEYETHRFAPYSCTDTRITSHLYDTTLDKGGGLRVKTITLKNGENDSNPQVRRYIYGPNGNGLAECTAAPVLSTFITVSRLLTAGGLEDMDTPFPCHFVTTINSISDYMTGQTGMPDLWYSCVTEVCNEGKTEYKFKNYCKRNEIVREWGKAFPFTTFTAFSKGPQMTSKTIYKKIGANFIPIEKDTLDYALVENDIYIRSVAVERLLTQNIFGEYAPDFGRYKEIDFHHVTLRRSSYEWFWLRPYDIYLQTEKYLGKKTITYTDNGTIERTERVEYVPGTELIARKTVSDGCDSIVTAYTYPSAAKGGINALMVAKNVIGSPIEVAMSYRGATQGYTLDMRQWSGLSVFRPIRISSFTVTDGKRVARNGNDYAYDSRGNITSSTDSAGVATRWTWDNVCAYPLTQSLGPSDKALTTTATWKMLVGVRSMTSPIGLKQLFDYDSEGRLIKQRQQDWYGREKLIAEYFYRIDPDGKNFAATELYTGKYSSLRSEVRYDFLGRPWGEFSFLPNSTAATLTEYDSMGRPFARWMPAEVKTSPWNIEDALADVKTDLGDEFAFNKTIYEASPRNLAVASLKAGSEWHSAGRKATVALLTNDRTSHKCTRYGITADGVEDLGLYAPGLLSVSVVTDEDGVTAETYTDLRGLKVAVVKGGGTTSYVYDRLGQLRYVLPPGLSGSHKRSDNEIQKLAFIYDYDSYGRCISKKIPGVRAAKYMYDPAGRLVAEKSANHSNEWRLYGYDAYGRLVVTADYAITEDEAREFASQSRTASLVRGDYEYDTGGYVFEPEYLYPCKVVTATYYDDYTFKSVRSLGSEYDFDDGHLDEEDVGHLAKPSGLVTGIYTGAGHEAVYYDDEGREIRRCGGKRGYNRGRTSTSYDYAGHPLTVHHRLDDDNCLRKDVTYVYDIAGRPAKTTFRISSGLRTIHRYDLDSLIYRQSIDRANIRIINDSVTMHNCYNTKGMLSSITYDDRVSRSFTYDIHGWLTKITTDLRPNIGVTPVMSFNDSLVYAGGRYPAYNGNISAKISDDGTYNYKYDSLNRLTDAVFSASPGKSHNYSAYYGYDCRSNLTSIRRWGLYDRDASGNEEYDEVDDISIRHDGNRAVSVDNCGDGAKFEDMVGSPSLIGMTLTYDEAGRLRSDETRGIVRIDYNNDGQPTRVWFADGHSQLDSYDGLGNRLSTAFYEAVTPVVAGKIPSRSRLIATRYYYGDGTVCRGDSVVMTRFGGGYFDGAGKPCYELADYQGNISTVIDSDGAIVSHTGFYPYGQPWRRPGELQWLYGGKEWLGADGRDEYDFHARRQYPHLGRFTTPDAHAESCHDISPYAYCAGNPIMFIDPTGQDSLRYNRLGELIMRQICEGDDYLEIVDNEGNITASTSVPDGTVEDVNIDTAKDEDSNDIPFLSMKIRGDDNGERLLQFFAQNTTVEWGRTELGAAGGSGLNLLTTSHNYKQELGFKSLFWKKLRHEFTIIRAYTHSHPGNTGPSSRKNNGGDPGDIEAAGIVEYYYGREIKWYVYKPLTDETVSYKALPFITPNLFP